MAKEQLEKTVEQPEAKVALQSSEILEVSSQKLSKYGGFSILETTIDGVQNLNPEKRPAKRYFLPNQPRNWREIN
jgi:hypothetical protein